MSWIVKMTSGWTFELGKAYYVRCVRASIDKTKYLHVTFVDRRSEASKFKTREAAERVAGYFSDPTTKVENY